MRLRDSRLMLAWLREAIEIGEGDVAAVVARAVWRQGLAVTRGRDDEEERRAESI